MSRRPETEEYKSILRSETRHCKWRVIWFGGTRYFSTDCGKDCQPIEFGKYCKHCGKPIVEIEK